MRRAVAGLVVALAASACSYDFNNPAEKLGTGQARGRVVVERTSGREPLAGTLVALENGPSFNQVTQTSGRFTLLSLPMGQHRVLFRKGTEWAAERIVEIAPGADGKPEGVNLGDVRLRYAVTLQGTFSLASLPGSFTPTVFDVTDEATGQPASLSTDVSGAVRWELRGVAVGPHLVRFAVAGDWVDPLSTTGVPVTRTFAAPPLALSIPESSEGQQITFNPQVLQPTAPGTPGALRFRVRVVGPNPPAAAAVATVELHQAATFDPIAPSSTSLVEALPVDSAGFVQADEPPGLYVVRIVSGAFGPDRFFEPPDPFRVVVRSGALSDLGTAYVVDSFTGSDAAFACFGASDCRGGTCVDFSCQGGSPNFPPSTAPFTMPYCLAGEQSCGSTPGQPCANGFGQCLLDCGTNPPFGAMRCFPSGTQSCTPDGTATATGTFGLICP